jgi:RHS repeat-associated protein
MQLGPSSRAQIPDGLLAAMTLLSEKPHQGVPTSTHTMHQGFGFVIANTALGMPPMLYDEGVGSRSTGKERDVESGNDYMFARYYNSATGRFLSPDWSAKEEPVPYAKLDNPQSLNLYSYVYNNPLGKADPDGHWPAWALAGGGTLEGAEDGAAAGGFLGGPVGAAVGAAIVATAVLLHEIPLPSGPATSVYGTGGCMACAAAATTKGEKAAPGPPKAATSPGVTAGNQGTDRYGNKTGPSGDPQVNQVDHPSKKAAEEAAARQGNGKPVKHTRPVKGGPHFHPADSDGEKIPNSTHHNYPD